jgi:hypothetical protein
VAVIKLCARRSDVAVLKTDGSDPPSLNISTLVGVLRDSDVQIISPELLRLKLKCVPGVRW